MDHVHRLIFLVLLVFSGSVFADTYPVYKQFAYGGIIYPSGQAACEVAMPPVPSQGKTTKFVPPTTCQQIVNDAVYTTAYISIQMTCPGGGTVSWGGSYDATMCINAPSCTSGQYRNATTHACQDSVICLYPEVDSGSGVCGPKPECLGSQQYNFVTKACATPPTCGTTEKLNPATFLCDPNPLRCPGHSHANSANDQCLADPALTCPIGMHDDGTYTCVADDVKGCTSDQRKGYIMGIPQCISKPHLDTVQQAAVNASSAKEVSSNQAYEAGLAAAASRAAADADPTNQTKQDQAAASQTAANNATSAANNATQASNKADNDAKNAFMKDTADNTRSLDDRAKAAADKIAADDLAGFGAVPTPETVPTTTQDYTTTMTGGSSGTCPAPYSINTSHGSIMMSYQPECDFATKIAPLVVSLSLLAGAILVFGAIKD